MGTFDRRVPRRSVLKGVGLAGLAAALGPGLPPLVRPLGAEPPPARVPRRILGRTGATVPILNMGACRLDPKFDPKIPEALSLGIDYFDTGYVYLNGSHEELLGANLKTVGERLPAAARPKLWITTKAYDVSENPAELRRQLETSLQRLQTDYVDMFFLHGVEQLSETAWKEAEKLRKEGKFRYFGFSSCFAASPAMLQRAAQLGWVDAAMIGYNFRLRPPENEKGEPIELKGEEKVAFDRQALTWGDEMQRALDAAHKAGIGLIAMKSQRSAISFADRAAKWEDRKYTKHQAVLKAVWEDERIASICSSMRTLEALRENAAAAVDDGRLGAAQWRALERYARDCHGGVCDRCDHICGAHLPPGMKVGQVLRCLMYHDAYGDPDLARAEFGTLPRAAWDTWGVDFTAASRACPNGVDIGRWMRRAGEVLPA